MSPPQMQALRATSSIFSNVLFNTALHAASTSTLAFSRSSLTGQRPWPSPLLLPEEEGSAGGGGGSGSGINSSCKSTWNLSLHNAATCTLGNFSSLIFLINSHFPIFSIEKKKKKKRKRKREKVGGQGEREMTSRPRVGPKKIPTSIC